MGDRGVIKVYQGKGRQPVCLYTHWCGDEIYGFLKRSLARRERWEDKAYLTRIIFCEMIKGHEDDTTGFGISTYIPDNEHTVLGVNPDKKLVTFEDEYGKVKGSVTFEQFVNRKDKYSV